MSRSFRVVLAAAAMIVATAAAMLWMDVPTADAAGVHPAASFR